MSLLDPNLLQLVGLGSSGDLDIPDGRHLRWIFHRLLGFPRSGFRLSRRPSMGAMDFDAPVAGSPPVRAQLTRRLELGTGARVRFPSGLTLSQAGGFAYGPAVSGGEPLLRIDARPVMLDFGPDGLSPPAAGELRSNPVAYLVLTVSRRARTGHVIARGYFDGRPGLRLVDRAAVGSDLRTHVGDLAAEVTSVGSTWRLLSHGERAAGPEVAVTRDLRAAAVLAARGIRPRWPRPPWVDLNPFVTETLLLHGGLLEHVEIQGHDANLLRLQWITTRDLLAARDWTELGRFHLPLTDAPDVYPAWSPLPGEQIASERLREAPPERQPPWDRESGGDPPLLLPSVPTAVVDSLALRYLGAEFKGVDQAMREFLAGEVGQVVPQSLVQVTERLEPDAGEPSGPEAVDVTVSPFDLLYGASVDPQVARELGLGTVDTSDPDAVYDYAIEAGFASFWVQWVLNPRLALERAESLREELAGAPASWADRRAFAPTSVASVLTGLRRMPAQPLEPPADLRAEVIPDPARSPVQARVRLHWARGAANLFDQPHRARVLYTLTRDSAAGAVLLHHRDDDTGLLAPHLPTPHGDPDPRLNLVDRQVPSYDTHTWRVAAMDLFGRVSADAEVSAEVRDTIPPPVPSNIEASLDGDATTGANWTGLTVAFDWLPAQEELAPDLAAFELHVRQGEIGTEAASLPGTWGRLETSPGATAGPLRIAWPSLMVTGSPPGLTAGAVAIPLPGGGQRITLGLSPIACPFDAGGYARLAVAVRAADQWDNAGGFAVARVERADLSVPAPPSFAGPALLATAPDAQNRSWFRVPLPALPGATVRVFRAPGVALLSAGSTSAADFAALSEEDRVGLLRSLGVAHRAPFAADHEQPVPADGGGYPLELAGFDRGYTVVHLMVENRTGARSEWPTDPFAFLVVRVPRQTPPPPPLVREVRVGDRSVLLRVAPDITGRTRSLVLYRSRVPGEAADVRRMRQVAEQVLPDPASEEPTALLDSGLYDEVSYFYRLVAVGEDGLRSAPSAALRATPVAHGPPDPPEVRAIERDPTVPDRRRVRLRVPRRDYPVLLFRRRRFAPDWEPAVTVDFAAFAATPDPAGWEVLVDDAVPAPDEDYAYFARIEDRRGRGSSSPALLETT
jgi:hypothetical protein